MALVIDESEIKSIQKEEVTTPPSDTIVELGVVLYTDGSVRPTNPGFGGWGVHGYTFSNVKIEKPISVKTVELENDDEDSLINKKDNCIITNKGYLGSTKVNNLENIFPVKPILFIDALGSHSSKITNNYAELSGIYNALKYCINKNFKYINIISDSEYIVLGMNERVSSYVRNNWRNKDGVPISNVEIWKNIYAIYKSLLDQGSEVTFSWVRAHVGTYGNELADSLSVTGMNYSTYEEVKEEITETTYKDYFEKDRHPFISYERIFFNSVEKYNKPGYYFQSKSNDQIDFVIGKRLAKAAYSIIKLDNPDKVIESVKERQFDVSNKINMIIMMMLDKVYNKNIFRYLNNHGKYCLVKHKTNYGLNFTGKDPITIEVNPTGLSLRAIENFNFLEDILDKFLSTYHSDDNKRTSPEKLNWINITDKFFTKETKIRKKEEIVSYVLNKEINDLTDCLKVSIDEEHNEKIINLNIPLVLGLDILPRNNLKRLEDLEPNIYLITWREAESSLRYATIIKCSESVGIWSNFFADRIIL